MMVVAIAKINLGSYVDMKMCIGNLIVCRNTYIFGSYVIVTSMGVHIIDINGHQWERCNWQMNCMWNYVYIGCAQWCTI